MIRKGDLKCLAEDYKRSARLLYKYGHNDRAVYFCGFSVELAFKYAVCKKLDWNGLYDNSHNRYIKPQKKLEEEAEMVRSFKTHRLYHLQYLAGVKKQIERNSSIKNAFTLISKNWDVEDRYRRCSFTKEQTWQILKGTVKLLNFLI